MQTTDTISPRPTSGGRSAAIVLGSVAVASVALGVLAYARYVQSEKALDADLAAITEQGRGLSVDGCVDEVVAWSRRCEAMQSLCDLSVPRMVFACLNAQDRRGWCKSVPRTTTETSFGFKECEARGMHKDRASKNTCATIYRSIDAHCKELEKADAAQAPGTEAM